MQIMALSEEHAKWAREAGEAFAAEEKAQSMLAKAGMALRGMFESVEDMEAQGLYDPLRAAFKAAYVATGKSEANVSSNWSRILYQYAWPGVKSAAGKWYKLDADGNSVRDKEKNTKQLHDPLPSLQEGGHDDEILPPKDFVERVKKVLAAADKGTDDSTIEDLTEGLRTSSIDGLTPQRTSSIKGPSRSSGGKTAPDFTHNQAARCVQFVRLMGYMVNVDLIDCLHDSETIEDLAGTLSFPLQDYFKKAGFYD